MNRKGWYGVDYFSVEEEDELLPSFTMDRSRPCSLPPLQQPLPLPSSTTASQPLNGVCMDKKMVGGQRSFGVGGDLSRPIGYLSDAPLGSHRLNKSISKTPPQRPSRKRVEEDRDHLFSPPQKRARLVSPRVSTTPHVSQVIDVGDENTIPCSQGGGALVDDGASQSDEELVGVMQDLEAEQRQYGGGATRSYSSPKTPRQFVPIPPLVKPRRLVDHIPAEDGIGVGYGRCFSSKMSVLCLKITIVQRPVTYSPVIISLEMYSPPLPLKSMTVMVHAFPVINIYHFMKYLSLHEILFELFHIQSEPLLVVFMKNEESCCHRKPTPTLTLHPPTHSHTHTHTFTHSQTHYYKFPTSFSSL